MDEYICDDREDINVLAEKIERMSDEEFEQFVEKMKENEHRSFVVV